MEEKEEWLDPESNRNYNGSSHFYRAVFSPTEGSTPCFTPSANKTSEITQKHNVVFIAHHTDTASVDFVYFAFVFCQVTVILGETALSCVLLAHVTHVNRELLNLFVADLISLKPPPTQLLAQPQTRLSLFSSSRIFVFYTD